MLVAETLTERVPGRPLNCKVALFDGVPLICTLVSLLRVVTVTVTLSPGQMRVRSSLTVAINGNGSCGGKGSGPPAAPSNA